MPKSDFKSKIYPWRVRSGAAGIIPAVILSRPNLISLLVGFGLSLAGLFLRAWASGHLRKEKELTVSGPYQYTRNPLYLGSFIIGAAIVIGCRSWWVCAIFTLYFLLFYPAVILFEKEKMIELFPQAYAAYSQKVPLFLPRLKPNQLKSHIRFSWPLYQQNKEIRALWGAVIFWVIITMKFIFL